jgi:hypothetical protein
MEATMDDQTTVNVQVGLANDLDSVMQDGSSHLSAASRTKLENVAVALRKMAPTTPQTPPAPNPPNPQADAAATHGTHARTRG